MAALRPARARQGSCGSLRRAQSAPAGRGTLCRSGRSLAGAAMTTSGGPARYEIRVAGVLDGRWAAWFNGLQISGQGDETVIFGLLADQPALHGLLTKVPRPRALPDLRAPAGHRPGRNEAS
jgi:hypothetical protein